MSSVSSCGTTPSRPRISHAVAPGVEPEHLERALRHGRDAADHAHSRRLPRAVRAEEPEGLAALEVEVDRVDGDGVAEALDEPAGMDQRLTVLLTQRSGKLVERRDLTAARAPRSGVVASTSRAI